MEIIAGDREGGIFDQAGDLRAGGMFLMPPNRAVPRCKITTGSTRGHLSRPVGSPESQRWG